MKCNQGKIRASDLKLMEIQRRTARVCVIRNSNEEGLQLSTRESRVDRWCPLLGTATDGGVRRFRKTETARDIQLRFVWALQVK